MRLFLMEIFFWCGMALSIAMIVSVIAFKRKDVSWLDVFFAGPTVLAKSSEMIEPNRISIPRTLFVLAIVCMIMSWGFHWSATNLEPYQLAALAIFLG
jgi:uncharacterized membrane protein YbaN (DUF454 family)